MPKLSLFRPHWLLLLPFVLFSRLAAQEKDSEYWLDLAYEDYTAPAYPGYVSKVIAAAEKEGNAYNWIRAYNEQYFVWYDQGDSLQKIEEKLREVLGRWSEIGELPHPAAFRSLGWLYFKWGSSAYGLGDFEAARRGFLLTAQNMKIGGLSKDSLYRYSLSPLMDIYCRWGDYEKAEQIFREGRDALREKSFVPDRIRLLSNWSRGLIDLRRYQEAESCLNEALSLRPDSVFLPFIYSNLGKLALVRLDGDAALDFSIRAEKSIPQRLSYDYSKEDQAMARAEVLSLQGQAYALKKDVRRSQQAFDECLALYKTEFPNRKRREKTKVMVALGKDLISNEKFELADSCLDSAMKVLIPPIKDKLPPDSLLFAENTLYEILETQTSLFLKKDKGETSPEKLKLTLQAYKKVLLVKDLLRARFAYESSKLFQQGESQTLLEKAINCAFQLYQLEGKAEYLEDINFFMDRNKSLVLAENMHMAQSQTELIPASQQDRLDSLVRLKTKWVNEQLDKGLFRDSLLDARIRQLDLVYQSELDRLELEHPEYFANRYRSTSLKIRDIQGFLTSDQVLFSYFWGEKESWVLAISKKKVAIKPLFIQRRQVEAFRDLLLSRNTQRESLKSFISQSKALFDELIPPDFSSFSQMIFLPDGPLYFIPFESLLLREVDGVDEGGTGEIIDQWRQLPYLGLEKGTTYAFSADLYFVGKESGMEKENLFLLGLAPAYEGNQRLTYNRKEIGQLTKLVPGTYFFDDRVSKATFVENYPEANVVHFATHGVADTSISGASYLLFSPDEAEKRDERLYAHEIYSLKLRDKFVVLSACETGYGKLASGEGVLSLARAFRHAGSQSMIMSLWLADGRASVELWPSFYDALNKGHSSIDALQMARKSYLAEVAPDGVHPFFWMSFVHLGPGIPPETGSMWWMWFLGLMVLATLVIGLMRRQK